MQTTTDKAYESAMSAAMATNKAATKKAETLSMDLDKLQYKLSKLTQEGAEQEEIIGMLQQQIVEGETDPFIAMQHVGEMSPYLLYFVADVFARVLMSCT